MVGAMKKETKSKLIIFIIIFLAAAQAIITYILNNE